jgi:hypothetical protein
MGALDQNGEARKLILSDVLKDPQKRPFKGPFFDDSVRKRIVP